MRPLLSSAALLCLTLCLFLLSLLRPSPVSAVCVDPSPLVNGTAVNIAVIVWVDAPHGLFTGRLSDTNATRGGYGGGLLQPYYLGLELYIDAMRARGGVLPLPNGENATMNFVYINLANAVIPRMLIPGTSDVIEPRWGLWNYEETFNGFPYFLYFTQSADVPGGALFPGIPLLSMPPGIMHRVVSQDPAVLAEFGVSTPFTFIVPPSLFLDNSSVALANMVEDARSHIVVLPFMSSVEMFICDGLSVAEGSLTRDCLAPPFSRGRREGARRFQTVISTLGEAPSNQLAALDNLHVLGVHSILIIREATIAGITFSKHAAQVTRDAATQLNIAVLDTLVTVAGLCPATGLRAATCPPAGAPGLGTESAHIWPDGKTNAQMAKHVAGLNPGALVILGSPGSPASWVLGQLFAELEKLDWTPQAISWGGGIEGGLEASMPHGFEDLYYTWNSKPWDPELRGPNYQNYQTATNFELHPAERATATREGRDGPGVFADLYDRTYGAKRPGGPHPMHNAPLPDNSTPAIGYATMVLIQKMLEASGSGDVETILAASHSMSRPGMYGSVALDVYGRTVKVPEVLQQQTPAGMRVLSPYNIGSPAVYPLPRWRERRFSPARLSTVGERALLGATVVCLLSLLSLGLLLIASHRAPVIRAATPSFCGLILLGAALMQASNFAHMMVVSDAECACQAWLLSVGFTILFASLFIKTWRIWRIFGTTRLNVVRMKDSELLFAVLAFVLVDVVINAAWQGAVGVRAREVTVDPVRPSHNYLECDYSNGGIGAVYAHLAIKGAMLLAGVCLTYAVRNTPSQFNESILIAACIYNTTFVLAFILPILGVGLGGREATVLIRGFAVLFVTESAALLLFVPKMILLRSDGSPAAAKTRQQHTQLDTQLRSEIGKDAGPVVVVHAGGGPAAAAAAHVRSPTRGATKSLGHIAPMPVQEEGGASAYDHQSTPVTDGPNGGASGNRSASGEARPPLAISTARVASFQGSGAQGGSARSPISHSTRQSARMPLSPGGVEADVAAAPVTIHAAPPVPGGVNDFLTPPSAHQQPPTHPIRAFGAGADSSAPVSELSTQAHNATTSDDLVTSM